MDEDINSQPARDIVLAWMHEHDVTTSELAAAAGLDRTVIHRFLRYARPINLRTALRIYAALHVRMDAQLSHALLVALKLEDIARLFNGVDDMVRRQTPVGHAKAIADLANAVELREQGRHVAAADLFGRSAHSLTIAQGLAFFAACERVRSLLAVGCFNAAREEIERIQARFGRICGIDDMLNLQSLRLRFAYELGDLSLASQIFRKVAFDAELHHNPQRLSEALYYGALVRLAYAMRATDAKKRERELGRAVRLFRVHDAYEHRHDSDHVAAGMRALRWAELHRTSRAESDAHQARRLAHQILRGTPAAYNVCLELAKVALERDQLTRSRRLAAEAREIAAAADNGLGVAHAAYVLAIADMMEERHEAALDHAVVSATLAPSWCYEDGTSALDFMRYAARSLLNRLPPGRRPHFESALRERVEQRRGPYAILASLTADQDRRTLHVFGSVSI